MATTTIKILLAPEAAQILRITPNRLYELAKRGMVPCVRIGRQVRFPEDRLLEWLASGGTSLPDPDKTFPVPLTNIPATSK